MHLDTPLSEQIEVLDNFYSKLRKSGYKHEKIRILFVEALLKFTKMVEKSKLSKNDPNYKPLYLSNQYNKVERGVQKYLRSFNWYDPAMSFVDNSWKRDIPQNLRPNFKNVAPNMQNLSTSSVLFVPNSNDGTLIKKLQEIEPKLVRLCGYRVNLVESGGLPLTWLFSLDLSGRRCHRADCPACVFPPKKGPSRCKQKSVVYESVCQTCIKNGSAEGVYIDESGRSLYERSREHLDDAKNQKDFSHIWKHWALCHQDQMSQPVFKFKVTRVHKTPLDRQLHEAIKIAEVGTLNSKCEFRQNQIKRLKVNLTAREVKEDEAKAKLDREIGEAVDILATKLKDFHRGNKVDNLTCFSAHEQ